MGNRSVKSWEYNNLAYDPRNAETLEKLRAIVKNRMSQVHDTVALSGKPKYLKDMRSKIPPTIKILYPNGGENLKRGTTATIVWTAEWKGTSTIQLEMNTGKGWKLVEKSITHEGSYSWKIPAVKSSKVKLRVSSADGKVWDESDMVFTIK